MGNCTSSGTKRSYFIPPEIINSPVASKLGVFDYYLTALQTEKNPQLIGIIMANLRFIEKEQFKEAITILQTDFQKMRTTLLGDIKEQNVSESLTLASIVNKYIANQFAPLTYHIANFSESSLAKYMVVRRETLQIAIEAKLIIRTLQQSNFSQKNVWYTKEYFSSRKTQVMKLFDLECGIRTTQLLFTNLQDVYDMIYTLRLACASLITLYNSIDLNINRMESVQFSQVQLEQFYKQMQMEISDAIYLHDALQLDKSYLVENEHNLQSTNITEQLRGYQLTTTKPNLYVVSP